jgi:hypothetical protein
MRDWVACDGDQCANILRMRWHRESFVALSCEKCEVADIL